MGGSHVLRSLELRCVYEDSVVIHNRQSAEVQLKKIMRIMVRCM